MSTIQELNEAPHAITIDELSPYGYAMTTSLPRRAWKSVHRLAWKPLVFPKEGTSSIPASTKLEEETIPGYIKSQYCPVRIGQIFENRYQVVGKLGFGVTSTVWLARDLE